MLTEGRDVVYICIITLLLFLMFSNNIRDILTEDEAGFVPIHNFEDLEDAKEKKHNKKVNKTEG
jgi:hypothetical protein